MITHTHTASRIPRTIECELMRDLVDACVPGDVVSVNGIVGCQQRVRGGFG